MLVVLTLWIHSLAEDIQLMAFFELCILCIETQYTEYSQSANFKGGALNIAFTVHVIRLCNIGHCESTIWH